MKTETRDSDKNSLAGKYLTVLLAGEAYGIAVACVREIIRMTAITQVPQLPAFVKGVINLRGKVIPVVDLRIKFGLPDATGERTCIVVVEVRGSGGGLLPMGLVVDAVDDVSGVSASDIEPTPHLGVAVDTSYLLGVAKVKGQVKLLLDIHRVVSAETVERAACAA